MRSSVMDGLSVKDQILMFYSADLVLSPHGSALVNLLFTAPHSTLIECNPPYFYEMWFSNIAWMSRMHYVSVTTYYTKWLKQEYHAEAEKLYAKGKFYLKRRDFSDSLVCPPLMNVLNALDDAVEYTKRWRFVYEISDKWSPLFF